MKLIINGEIIFDFDINDRKIPQYLINTVDCYKETQDASRLKKTLEILTKKAHKQTEQGEIDDAYFNFALVVRAAQELLSIQDPSNRYCYFRYLNNLGVTLKKQYYFQKAYVCFKEAEAIATTISITDSGDYAAMEMNLCNLFSRTGQYLEAIKRCDFVIESITSGRVNFGTKLLYNAKHNKSIALYNLGRFEEAFCLIDEIEAYYLKHHDQTKESRICIIRVMHDKEVIYQAKGLWEKALEQYKRALVQYEVLQQEDIDVSEEIASEKRSLDEKSLSYKTAISSTYSVGLQDAVKDKTEEHSISVGESPTLTAVTTILDHKIMVKLIEFGSRLAHVGSNIILKQIEGKIQEFLSEIDDSTDPCSSLEDHETYKKHLRIIVLNWKKYLSESIDQEESHDTVINKRLSEIILSIKQFVLNQHLEQEFISIIKPFFDMCLRCPASSDVDEEGVAKKFRDEIEQHSIRKYMEQHPDCKMELSLEKYFYLMARERLETIEIPTLLNSNPVNIPDILYYMGKDHDFYKYFPQCLEEDIQEQGKNPQKKSHFLSLLDLLLKDFVDPQQSGMWIHRGEHNFQYCRTQEELLTLFADNSPIGQFTQSVVDSIDASITILSNFKFLYVLAVFFHYIVSKYEQDLHLPIKESLVNRIEVLDKFKPIAQDIINIRRLIYAKEIINEYFIEVEIQNILNTNPKFYLYQYKNTLLDERNKSPICDLLLSEDQRQQAAGIKNRHYINKETCVCSLDMLRLVLIEKDLKQRGEEYSLKDILNVSKTTDANIIDKYSKEIDAMLKNHWESFLLFVQKLADSRRKKDEINHTFTPTLGIGFAGPLFTKKSGEKDDNVIYLCFSYDVRADNSNAYVFLQYVKDQLLTAISQKKQLPSIKIEILSEWSEQEKEIHAYIAKKTLEYIFKYNYPVHPHVLKQIILSLSDNIRSKKTWDLNQELNNEKVAKEKEKKKDELLKDCKDKILELRKKTNECAGSKEKRTKKRINKYISKSKKEILNKLEISKESLDAFINSNTPLPELSLKLVEREQGREKFHICEHLWQKWELWVDMANREDINLLLQQSFKLPPDEYIKLLTIVEQDKKSFCVEGIISKHSRSVEIVPIAFQRDNPTDPDILHFDIENPIYFNCGDYTYYVLTPCKKRCQFFSTAHTFWSEIYNKISLEVLRRAEIIHDKAQLKEEYWGLTSSGAESSSKETATGIGCELINNQSIAPQRSSSEELKQNAAAEATTTVGYWHFRCNHGSATFFGKSRPTKEEAKQALKRHHDRKHPSETIGANVEQTTENHPKRLVNSTHKCNFL
jgi:hypothetical protein